MSGLVLTGPRHLWVPLILRTAGGWGSRSFGESEPLDVTGLSCDLPCLSDLGAHPVPEQCPTCGGGCPPLPPLWGGSYSTSPFEPRSRGSHRDPHMPVGKGHLCPHGPGGSLSLLPCPPPPSQELLSPSTQRPFSLSPFQGRKGDSPPPPFSQRCSLQPHRQPACRVCRNGAGVKIRTWMDGPLLEELIRVHIENLRTLTCLLTFILETGTCR